METITARFKHNTDAANAVMALRRSGFVMGPQMPFATDTEFDLSAHAAVSPGAEESSSTASKGAAIGGLLGVIVGLTLTPLVGPAGAVAGAGVGAYTGSLVGALAGMEETSNEQAQETSASLTVSVADSAGRTRVLEILHEHDVEHVSEE